MRRDGGRGPTPGYGSCVRVSAKVDYALRAMLELAVAEGLVKSERVAAAQSNAAAPATMLKIFVRIGIISLRRLDLLIRLTYILSQEGPQ